jgi:hypothetical protein
VLYATLFGILPLGNITIIIIRFSHHSHHRHNHHE